MTLFIALKILRQNPKLLIKTFGEIGRGAESHDKGNLIDAILLLAQEFRRLLQTNQ